MGLLLNRYFGRLLNHIVTKFTRMERKEEEDQKGPWKELPKDIMERIALRLNLNDYIRSSLVCKSWRALLLQSDNLRPQFPWLLLPYYSNCHQIEFYNFIEKKNLTFKLGADGGAKVIGCCKGWVILAKKHHDSIKISLFNPIFGVVYDLPLLSTMTTSSANLQRIELSSPSISNCRVAAIFDDSKQLALCKLGNHHHEKDGRWEVVEIEIGRCFFLLDVLFCKEKLHVLIKSETSNGEIENYNYFKLPNNNGEEEEEEIEIILVHDLMYKNINDNIDLIELEDAMPPSFGFKVYVRNLHISYLVESTKGQVMLIQKHHCLFYATRNDQQVVNVNQEYLNVVLNNNDDDVVEQNTDDEEGEDHYYDDDDEDDEEGEDHYYDDDEDADDGDGDGDEEWNNGEEEFDISPFMRVVDSLDGFKIYEIEDLRKGKKVCKGLGKEETLFLSSKSRMCVQSNDINFMLQGNSINFLMDIAKVADDEGLFLIGFDGIYNLYDSTIRCLPGFRFFSNTKIMWFAPNLVY